MPTYEYECSKCGKTFEIFQSMKDPALVECPESHCQEQNWGRGPVKRLIGSGAGLIFKGSGFYITDYRSENYKQSAQKESGTSKSSDSKPSESKTQTSTSSNPSSSSAPPSKSSNSSS